MHRPCVGHVRRWTSAICQPLHLLNVPRWHRPTQEPGACDWQTRDWRVQRGGALSTSLALARMIHQFIPENPDAQIVAQKRSGSNCSLAASGAAIRLCEASRSGNANDDVWDFLTTASNYGTRLGFETRCAPSILDLSRLYVTTAARREGSVVRRQPQGFPRGVAHAEPRSRGEKGRKLPCHRAVEMPPWPGGIRQPGL